MCQVWGRPIRDTLGLPRTSGFTHTTPAGPAEWSGLRPCLDTHPLLLMGLVSSLAAPSPVWGGTCVSTLLDFLWSRSSFLHTFV